MAQDIHTLENRIKELEATVELLKKFVGYNDKKVSSKRSQKRKAEREAITRAIIKSK